MSILGHVLNCLVDCLVHCLVVVSRLSCDCLVDCCAGRGMCGLDPGGDVGSQAPPHRGVLQEVACIGMLPSRWVGHALVDFFAILCRGACCCNLCLACPNKSARVRECRSAAIWDFFWRGGLRDDPEDGTVWAPSCKFKKAGRLLMALDPAPRELFSIAFVQWSLPRCATSWFQGVAVPRRASEKEHHCATVLQFL